MKAFEQQIKVAVYFDRINGKIAYVPQIPWIFSGTVEENILFGSEFDNEKYHKVIEACALVKVLSC